MSDLQRVAHARSIEELVVFVHEFRASLPARVAALLPIERPGPAYAGDIREAAMQLARVRALDVVAREEIEPLFDFYTEAAARLARLESARATRGAGPRPAPVTSTAAG
jgi:hypothetical protein